MLTRLSGVNFRDFKGTSSVFDIIVICIAMFTNFSATTDGVSVIFSELYKTVEPYIARTTNTQTVRISLTKKKE